MGSYIHYYQQDQDGQENQGEEWSQLRCQTALARIGIDKSGQCLQSATTLRKVGHTEVVDTQSQTQDKSTNHSWPQFWHHHLAQCLEWSSTQVQRCLVDIRIHLCQSWHYAQHHIWRTEHHVRRYHCAQAATYAQEYE